LDGLLQSDRIDNNIIMSNAKIPILFFDDREVLAAWDEQYSKWWFSVLDYNGIIALGKEFPGKRANRFIEWFTFSDESIDGKSKMKE
jgi:hypothetical protein